MNSMFISEYFYRSCTKKKKPLKVWILSFFFSRSTNIRPGLRWCTRMHSGQEEKNDNIHTAEKKNDNIPLRKKKWQYSTAEKKMTIFCDIVIFFPLPKCHIVIFFSWSCVCVWVCLKKKARFLVENNLCFRDCVFLSSIGFSTFV